MRYLIFAVLAFALVACGSAPVVTPTPSVVPTVPSSPVQTSEIPTALPATLSIHPHVAIPTPEGVTCGTVEIRDNRIINPTDAQAAEGCLWQAFQNCLVAMHPALVVRTSTDETPFTDQTGYISFYESRSYTVITDGNGGCNIDTHSVGGPYRRNLAGTPIAGPGTHPNGGTTCTSMSRDPNGDLKVTDCKASPGGTTFDIPYP